MKNPLKDDAYITIRILNKDNKLKHGFKIWADGKTEGFIGSKALMGDDGDFLILNNGIRPYIQQKEGQIICLNDKLERLV